VRARGASSYLRTRGRWCPRRTCPGTSPRGSIAWEKECGCVGDTVSGGRKEEPRDGGRSRRMEISDGDMGGRGRLTLGTPGGRWSARPCTSKAWATGIPQRRSPRTCSPSRCGTRASGSRAPRRRSWSAFFCSLDQTGGSLGCALIAPVRSSFRAVSRVAVTCGVNDEGSEPSCKSASTVFNTA
jgi:hypothetical protein